MTGIEKSIIIVLFALIFLVLGFIILWMISFYRDRKRDNTNANANFKNLWKQCDDLIVKYDSLNYELKQLRELREKHEALSSKKKKEKNLTE